MNDQPANEPYSAVRDQQIRAALDQHWAASDANDFETEHLIYHEDAVLEYPQSGERTRGRRNIQGQRASQPSNKRFTVRRITHHPRFQVLSGFGLDMLEVRQRVHLQRRRLRARARRPGGAASRGTGRPRTDPAAAGNDRKDGLQHARMAGGCGTRPRQHHAAQRRHRHTGAAATPAWCGCRAVARHTEQAGLLDDPGAWSKADAARGRRRPTICRPRMASAA